MIHIILIKNGYNITFLNRILHWWPIVLFYISTEINSSNQKKSDTDPSRKYMHFRCHNFRRYWPAQFPLLAIILCKMMEDVVGVVYEE